MSIARATLEPITHATTAVRLALEAMLFSNPDVRDAAALNVA
jgi:hypothetical protein